MRRPVSSGMLHVSDIKAILHFIDFEVLEKEIKDFQTVVDELEGNGVALAETEKDVLEAVNQRDKGLKAKKRGGIRTLLLLTTLLIALPWMLEIFTYFNNLFDLKQH